MMSLPLHIMVTRPDPGGAELCEAIRAQGDVALHFPTIMFAPPLDVLAFERAIALLGEQDWLVFVSPQAVRASVPAIRRVWPVMPASVRFAAVGAGTASALEQAGYRADYVPVGEWSSEGLLSSAEFKAMNNQRVAVIRGEGGRELLERVLLERGAQVISVIAYQRTVPILEDNACLERLQAGKVDVIVCTSYEGVANLKLMVGEAGWSVLKRIPLIVVSERIKALAADAGFQTIWVSANAGHQAILAVIAQKRSVS